MTPEERIKAALERLDEYYTAFGDPVPGSLPADLRAILTPPPKRHTAYGVVWEECEPPTDGFAWFWNYASKDDLPSLHEVEFMECFPCVRPVAIADEEAS